MAGSSCKHERHPSEARHGLRGPQRNCELVTYTTTGAGLAGLGFVILHSKRAFQTQQIYAWIVIPAAPGAGLNLLLDRVEHHIVRDVADRTSFENKEVP
jgi:hypothetical protein